GRGPRAGARAYAGQVSLTLRGREPEGCVARADRDGLLAEIADGLRRLPGPGGRDLPVEVLPGDDVFDGPHAGRCPDLCLQFDGLRHLAADRVGVPEVVAPP